MQAIARVAISAMVMTGAVVTEPAHAQPSDASAVAEQLFKQARELAKALCGSNLVCGTDNYAQGQQLIRDT